MAYRSGSRCNEHPNFRVALWRLRCLLRVHSRLERIFLALAILLANTVNIKFPFTAKSILIVPFHFQNRGSGV